MIVTLDDNRLPLFKRISVKNDDAIASNRGQNGGFNADRSYKKDEYTLEYDFIDIAEYNIIKNLYDQQFATGTFYTFRVIDSDYPVAKQVYIAPQSIVPRFAGRTIEGYTLTLIEK